MSVNCTNCSAENDDGRRFCDQCGTSLAAGCPNCGSENRPEARFCGNCGTSLTPAALATGIAPSTPGVVGAGREAAGQPATSPTGGAERRLVSVLFADLVAFTSFSEGRDPEIVRDTLTRYFEVAREAIERHGGRVEKFIGDAVMAAWGAPKANEDDAERAVRAALEVVDAVKGLDGGLEARVAVLTGQAAVTLGAQDQGMVAGDLVNTAARLQGVAPPSTVLVGEATMQAAASAVAFEPAGDQVLKGKDAPVPAWRVLRVVSERGGRSRAEGLEPPFVGREVELRLLKDLLHAIGEEQRPRLISITGPAGIGKSRLAWEFEKYVDGLVESIFWHRGRAPSYGEGVTFWALGEMVRKRAGLAESDDEATTRARIAETVAEYVPDDDDRSWVEPALLTLLGVEPAPAGGRDVLFAAWRIFFERVASNGTTVLLFEDLQWADSGQLDFIDHLMEWSKGVPLLVVTLARPDLLERRPGWGTGARSFNTIGLEPLTDDQMRELLLGLVPELPASAVDTVLGRADGIPLYAVETVRMLIADGRLLANDDGTFRPSGDLGELAVPDSLRALIASRLDGLEDEDRALLQDAAVLGKTFAADALAAISGDEESQLEGRLRLLVKRELLEISVDPRSPERGQYGFVQSVIREVAYDTLSRRDRRTRHLAAARYFEGLGDDELAGVLSNHYLAAYQSSDPGPEADALQIQARLALRGAAARAMSLGAADQAIVCLRQALDITEATSERAELLAQAADAADQEGSYGEAEQLAREAIEAYRAADDHTGVTRVSAQLGKILADASKLTEAREFLEAALVDADGADDAPLRADLLARLSRVHMRLVETDLAIARADEALAIAEPLRLDGIIAEAFVNKGAALSAAGRLREPAIVMKAAIELAASIGDANLELRARNNLGAVTALEDARGGMQTWREAYDLALRLGVPQMTQWIASAVGYGAIYEGLDWEASLQLLNDELERSRSDADRNRLLATMLYTMAWRGDDTGELEAARAPLEAAVSDPDSEAWTVAHGAQLALMAGRLDEAFSEYRRAHPLSAQTGGDAVLGMILASHWARDLEGARVSLELAESEPWRGNYVDGLNAAAHAGVAALEGRSDEAVALFRRSVDSMDASGTLFMLALVQLDALILLPDEPSIAEWADVARARFELLKARPLLERLDEAIASRAGRQGITSEAASA